MSTPFWIVEGGYMTAPATRLLSAVQARGGHVRLDGKNLLVEAAKPLPAELIEQLRCHKPEIVSTLAEASHQIEPFERDAPQKRAAIMEANGISHEWAEGYATLCTMLRPVAYTPERWQRIVDDGGHFLERWGRSAATLGWSVVDVFGVNPVAPESRYDGMGLVVLLDGRRVRTIKKDAAGIDCGNGVVQTFYRRKINSCAVALWELGGK